MCIRDSCELIPSSADFTIYRRDRKNRRGGGVFLAVKNILPSIRRRDLETNDAEILACELRPDSRRKILAVVFYRPQDTDLEYLKQLKKTLLLALKAKFDQILVIGDFMPFPLVETIYYVVIGLRFPCSFTGR